MTDRRSRVLSSILTLAALGGGFPIGIGIPSPRRNYAPPREDLDPIRRDDPPPAPNRHIADPKPYRKPERSPSEIERRNKRKAKRQARKGRK